MSFTSYRQASRTDWGEVFPDGTTKLNIEQVNCGAILRIADAVEKMASTYDKLRDERDHAIRWRDTYRGDSKRKDRRISALRGVITRMKRKEAK